MADTETNFAHLHGNGEVFMAHDLEAARGMCPVLGKLSLEEAGLLLELEAMGNTILAAQQESPSKTKITTEATKPENDKFWTVKDKAEHEIPSIKASAYPETAAKPIAEHPALLVEQSEQADQDREVLTMASQYHLQAEELRRQNLSEGTTTDNKDTSPKMVIKTVESAKRKSTTTPEKSVKPQQAEQLKTPVLDKPTDTESYADRFQTNFTRREIIDFPGTERAEAIQVAEGFMPESALETTHDEDTQPAADLVSFTSEMLPPLPDKTAGTTPEATATMSVILPRELAEQLETLESEDVIIVHELLNELVRTVEAVQSPHTAATPEEAAQAEKQVEEALASLVEYVGMAYSDSQMKAYVRQIVVLAEPATRMSHEANGINYALSHYGTHEGLQQQFTLNHKQFRKVTGSLHTVLGKFALFLSTLQGTERTEVINNFII